MRRLFRKVRSRLTNRPGSCGGGSCEIGQMAAKPRFNEELVLGIPRADLQEQYSRVEIVDLLHV